jgi:SNF2 family DNA or RNA helicase
VGDDVVHLAGDSSALLPWSRSRARSTARAASDTTSSRRRRLATPKAERTLQPLATPPGFEADLRPYQRRGLSWLAFLSDLGLGACLADDMGLGKTIQLLALEAHERGERPDARPTLLLCPMSLVGNWQREAARFAPRLRT